MSINLDTSHHFSFFKHFHYLLLNLIGKKVLDKWKNLECSLLDFPKFLEFKLNRSPDGI
jgi:hypothetical protein